MPPARAMILGGLRTRHYRQSPPNLSARNKLQTPNTIFRNRMTQPAADSKHVSRPRLQKRSRSLVLSLADQKLTRVDNARLEKFENGKFVGAHSSVSLKQSLTVMQCWSRVTRSRLSRGRIRFTSYYQRETLKGHPTRTRSTFA
jgi:hypothetical protein